MEREQVIQQIVQQKDQAVATEIVQEKNKKIKAMEDKDLQLNSAITISAKNILKNFTNLESSENNNIKELNVYIQRGESIIDTQQVRWIKKLILAIYNENKIQKDGKRPLFNNIDKNLNVEMNLNNIGKKPQFIFICASSGTGKTQLAFSLDIPLLYFQLNPPTDNERFRGGGVSQFIYGNYFNVSEALMTSVQRDLVILRKIQSDNEDDPYVTMSIQTPLFLPALICMFCSNIMKISGENEKWILRQLRISGDVNRMTILDATAFLEKLFESKPKPVIFFDECQKPSESKDFIKSYVYVRRCMGMLGLVSIFMGTNAKMANFVNPTAASGSRGEGIPENLDIPWCFVVHKLTPTVDSFIQDLKDTAISIIDQMHPCTELNARLKKFVSTITKSLAGERPLFVHLICEHIIKCVSKGETDPLTILTDAINHLIVEFKKRKSFSVSLKSPDECKSYNFSNLTMISPEFWRETSDKEVKNSNRSDSEESDRYQEVGLEKSQGIHSHMAYLYVPDEIQQLMTEEDSTEPMNFFGLTIEDDCLSYTGIRKTTLTPKSLPWSFEPAQAFLPFEKEPFGQLAFLGKENFQDIFISMSTSKSTNRRKRISTFLAAKQIHDKHGLPTSNIQITWTVFEISVAMSALIATHHNGFRGSSFRDWLRYFVREMNVQDTAKYPESAPNITFPDDIFWNNHKKDIIPLCTSSISASWNKTLGDYLKNDLSANIGILHANLKNESRDFYIKEYGCKESTIILTGECKCYKDGVKNVMIESTVKKLKQYSSHINLIVVNRLQSQYKERTEGVNVYLLKEDDVNGYFIHTLNSKDDNDKGVLIIEQAKIC